MSGRCFCCVAQFKERNEEAKQRKEQLAIQERDEDSKERVKPAKGEVAICSVVSHCAFLTAFVNHRAFLTAFVNHRAFLTAVVNRHGACPDETTPLGCILLSLPM